MKDMSTTDRDVNRAIRSWLHEDRHEDASRIAGAVLSQTETTPQRRATWWPARRILIMNRVVTAGLAAAAVIAVLLVGAQLFGPARNGGVGSGAAPSPEPSVAEPTEPPSPTGPPQAPADGVLEPGTYAAHPLPAPNDSLTLTFTVGEGWQTFGNALVPSGEPDTGPPAGMAILFEDVTSVNGDPCRWSGTDDDVSVGPAVDDLVEALRAQTAYEVSDPVDVTIGGYSGKRVDIVIPTEPFAAQDSTAPECDQDVFQLWTTAASGELGIHAQGPADRWHTNILDVDGTRLVVVTRDFEGTSPEHRADMDAIIDSLVIEP